MSETKGLDRIVARVRAALPEKQRAVPLSVLEKRAQEKPRPLDFLSAVRQPNRVSVIAELKKASPSGGLLRADYDVAAGAKSYAAAGARALSILTEENYFLGEPDHLEKAKAASGLPVLRKDFVVDPYQIHEARAFGADAVLLIVALLEDKTLRALLSIVKEWGMTPLVEAHDALELRRAVDVGAMLVGINSRNLKDLTMNPGAFEALLPRVPPGVTAVAESGLKTAEDVKKVRALGARAVLVGESLLRQNDLESATRVLVEAGQ